MEFDTFKIGMKTETANSTEKNLVVKQNSDGKRRGILTTTGMKFIFSTVAAAMRTKTVKDAVAGAIYHTMNQNVVCTRIVTDNNFVSASYDVR